MKIQLSFNPDVETVTPVTDSGGKIVGVTITPHFISPKGNATVVQGTATTDAGVAIEKFVLAVSGKTGKVGKIAYGTKVTAAIDAPEAKTITPPPPPAAADARPRPSRPLPGSG